MPYFDHNATAPLVPAARAAWLRAQDEVWYNPSSPTRAAARVRIRLETARGQLAQFLGGEPGRIVFNSGATEGANAVLAHWARLWPPGARVALSPTEHPCVLEAARAHFGETRIAWLPVTHEGVVRVVEVEKSLSTAVAGVVVMAANNETGVLQPWMELAACCRRVGVPFLCDATQWLGKLPGSGLGGAGWVIGSAHKFGGPKGVGFLQVGPAAENFCAQHGGTQEQGRRGGTENFPGVIAMLAALADAETTKVLFETERLRWRKNFERAMVAAVPGAMVVAGGAERLWNTVSLLLPHGESERWIARLERRDFLVSTGAACATGKAGPSHVLAAMGLAVDEARRVVRVSAGWNTTEADWAALAEAFAAAAPEVQSAANLVKT
ncbi:MAG: aminotransferase class V-fold PLP-dependent enzyme [Verrucomicrobiota bacterium]